MGVRWKAAVGVGALLVGLVGAGPVAAASGSGTSQGSPPGSVHTGQGPALPSYEARVCGAPGAGDAHCTSIRLLQPARYWHPGKRPGGGGSGSGGTPASGYYPADLQSAYGLTSAAGAERVGSETVAIVDAYDDPNAASDLAAYRASLSGATDAATGLADARIPPLCSSGASPCVTFTKVNQNGGTSYPGGNTGWAEEISVDLDMVSAICPACNIVLVEASSSSLANLAQAVNEAKTFHPVAITNSYGGGETSSETSYNGTYSASSTTAVTVAAGDSGYGTKFPAASPGVTAVGGTSLTYAGNGTWAPQTVWSSAGSGCSAYEPLPAWQADPNVYSLSGVCAGRQVADVSADANPATGVAVYDTFHTSGWMVFGGTSVAAQIIGATYAVAAGTGSLRALPSSLYVDSGSGGTGPTPGLVPVTSGSNGSCGDYLCNAAYDLSSGYDGPAGLGTPSGVGAFATASQATSGSLSFSPASESLTAGAASGPLSVDLSSAAPAGGLTVNLSTSSSTGGFSTSSSGPWSATLAVTVSGSGTASQAAYYHDTTAGAVTLTASAAGWTSATQTDTVGPAALQTIHVSPSSASVAEGGNQVFTAAGTDPYGNPVTIDPTWSTSAPGTLSATTGTSTTFTAGASAGSGSVTAAQGGVSGSASVTVTAVASMSVTVTAGATVRKGPNYHTPLTVTAADASTGSAIGGASATLDVYAGACPASGGPSGNPVASTSGTTGSNGQLAVTFTTRSQGTYCAAASVSAGGYGTGDGMTTFAN